VPTVLNCWKCGASLKEVLLPLSRLAKCPACKADLHVCRMCEFYDRTVSKMCREPIAEEVKDKQRANFCGYLQPNPRAYAATDRDKAGSGKSELEALFGMKPGTAAGTTTDPDAARRKLEDLFGMRDDKPK
jgi:hypothetical protein